jgi:hypothetical protein
VKKYEEHKMVVYSLVYKPLSESSRVELKEYLQWLELSNAADLLCLIRRIRATHIARQSGNPGMDKERVRMVWANMRMQSNETAMNFGKGSRTISCKGLQLVCQLFQSQNWLLEY